MTKLVGWAFLVATVLGDKSHDDMMMRMSMMMIILAGWALLATTVADLRPQEGDEPQLPDSHKRTCDDDDSDDDGDDDDKKSRFDCVQCPSKLLVPTPFTSYVCIRLYIHPSPINNPSVI